MRITIENFGAIKHFEFDTDKDMYLIFGKNSIGKSYAISLIYLILKLFKRNVPSFYFYEASYFFEKDIKSYAKELDQKIQKIGDEEFDLSDNIEKILISYLKRIFIQNINDSLINTFNDISNLQNQLVDQKVNIKIDCCNIGLSIFLGLKKDSTPSEFEINDYALKQQVVLKKSKTCRNLKRDKKTNKIIIYYPENKKEHFERNYLIFINGIISSFSDELQSINNVYYLPASRSGLYQALGAFGQIIAELAKNRSFISKGIELPAISEPLADYFLRLSSITVPKKQSSHDFLTYSDEIENEILHGTVEFDSKSKRLFFLPKETKLRLDLSATSSMVSEISPIVSYLKYILPGNRNSKKEQKPLVFIEEPEAHLHPETQIKLMKVFARLVKDDKIKLVMTSHSNYIFNKASNLVMDGKIDPDKFKAVLFTMTEMGSIAEDMATDAYGIDDDNFIDTAESLYEEKLALINKLNG